MSSTPDDRRRFVHVVAGVLVDAGRVCITRRRADVHQGGKWEFPGGKLEPGEDALSGLKRELREELGIEVQQAEPLVRVEHRYPELDVLLDVWRVSEYRGTPHGRESQELAWTEIERLEPDQFPEADRPVLRRLQLPPLYVISDAQRLGADVFATRLEHALAAGARLVQLREPQLERAAFCDYARRVAAMCRTYGARLLVNADPSWVDECEADGVHLNATRLRAATVRPLGPGRLVAASCHDAAEIGLAQSLGVDFAVLGAVKPTASHPGGPVLGWDRFAELVRPSALPIYAIGGMHADDLHDARASGAHGIAMISGVWNAPDVGEVVRQTNRR